LLRADEERVVAKVVAKAKDEARDEARAVVAKVARGVLPSKQLPLLRAVLHLKPLPLHPKLRLALLERHL
jgi:hypothetical protein